MRRYNVGSNAILSLFRHSGHQARNFSAEPCPIDPPRHGSCVSLPRLRTMLWTIADLLHMPAKNGDKVAHCKRVHAQIVALGLSGDTYLANLMLKLLGKCVATGMEYARLLFDKMPERNLVSWATMISAYNGHGLSEDAVLVFLECLRRSEQSVNEFILAGVIRGCTQLGGAGPGVQVHCFVVKLGFDQDVFVGTSLTDFYSKQGDIDRARVIFVELEEKTTVSWTTIISGYVKCGRGHEALVLFNRLVDTEVLPDMYVISSALSACSTLKFLEGGEQIHCYGVRRGLDSDISVTNVLIDLYTKCSRVNKGRKLFDQMAVKNLVSWTTMISGYMQNSFDREAMKLFADMFRLSWKPDAFACSSVLNSCGSVEAIELGRQVHTYSFKANLEGDEFVTNGLIDMYSKCDSLIDARRVFDTIHSHNIISYGAMIEGYANLDRLVEASDLFRELRLHDLSPSNLIFVSILGVAASLCNLVLSKQIHGLIIKVGISLDILTGTSLVDVYSKCACLKEARFIFEAMNERDTVVWNAMLFGYTQQLEDEEALILFRELQLSEQKPDAFTFAAMVSAAGNLASLRNGQQFHCQILQFGFNDNLYVANALVDMYAKCGSIEEAHKMFDSICWKDVVIWNSIISKYAHHGEADKSLKMFDDMVNEGIKPNSVTFLSVLSACSHVGFVEDGFRHFTAMRGFGIEPGTEHYAAMVSLLGRADKLQEAYNFIQQMPIQPAAIVWRSLLSACRAAGNTELGRYAGEMAIQNDPNDSASYVLLSNILASDGKWADARKVRERMDLSGTVKEPGCSWIESDNKVHVFIARDQAHRDSDTIYSVLNTLILQIKESRNLPENASVLCSIE
ncbi:unnamed protein product [Rhodiola kirilowii]